MKSTLSTLVVASLLILGCSDGAYDGVNPAEESDAISASVNTAAANGDYASFEVTVYNLTSGQPFTPPLLATHNKDIDLFEAGAHASAAIQAIAENGNLDPALAALGASDDVSAIVVAVAGDPPPLMPGASITTTISAERPYRLLSMASMLICTNDGFTGMDAVVLPKNRRDVIEIYANAYDAGTEINTEDFADIVPPCQGLVGISSDDAGTGESNPALYEGGVIHPHAGVAGGDDLQVDPHGWEDPVAKIVIRRIG